MKKYLVKIVIIAVTLFIIIQAGTYFNIFKKIQNKISNVVSQSIPTNKNQKRNETAGIVIHNDAGKISGSQYNFLANKTSAELSKGFAHYYVAKDDIYNFWSDDLVAWHTNDLIGNGKYIGIEVTNSYGNQNDFLNNEQEAFKLAAKILKKYNLKPDQTTIMLHQEFTQTQCPHRSLELHGNNPTSVKNYFISEVSKYN
jgi:N-acetylmuramoyl-L-alanine amidase